MPGLKGVALVLFSLSISQAEEMNSWTNRAGHVLKAAPVSIQGQLVTFKQASNETAVNYPLTVFLPAEQERLRLILQDTTVPEGLKAPYEFARRTLHRSQLLHKNGSITATNFQHTTETTLAAFRTQAAPYIAKNQLSPERLDLIIRELVDISVP